MRIPSPNPQLIINHLKNMSKKQKVFVLLLIFLSQVLIAITVYFTGGIQFVYSHSMYIPIMFSALVFGHKISLVIAIIGGLLLGPFMPINTATGLMQLPINWIYRIIFFMIIGNASGQFYEHTNQYYLQKIKLLTFFEDSDIYKLEILTEHINKIPTNDLRDFLVVKVRINNRENLIDVIDTPLYFEIFNEIASLLKQDLPEILGVYARSYDGLIVCYHQRYHQDYLAKIQAISSKTYTINDVQIFIIMSIGITDLTDNLNETINKASIASSVAFENNSDYAYYSGELSSRSHNFEVLGSVQQSIDNNDFYLVFQPKIDLKSGKYIGSECLIRWNHPIMGELPPNEFIPLIENTVLINTLTKWIVQNVLLLLDKYKDVYDAQKYPIAINLSASSLLKKYQFDQEIMKLLGGYSANEKIILFEITESILMQNPKNSIEMINNLEKHNIYVSIDDFGTGYSSLEYLSQLRVQELKIDRGFISRMTQSQKDLTLVSATISLAKALNIKTVAEGVETSSQVDILKKLECDFAQGYYFAKPMSFEDILVYKDLNQ